VVFIPTDDQRSDCLGVAGHPFLKTPNLDRLAKAVRRSRVPKVTDVRGVFR
jgi:arylsulfatase A-like enzyme